MGSMGMDVEAVGQMILDALGYKESYKTDAGLQMDGSPPNEKILVVIFKPDDDDKPWELDEFCRDFADTLQSGQSAKMDGPCGAIYWLGKCAGVTDQQRQVLDQSAAVLRWDDFAE